MRSSASKLDLSRAREPRPQLAAVVDAADGADKLEEAPSGAHGVGGELVPLVRKLVRAFLRLCLRLLGMDALLSSPTTAAPSVATRADDGLSADADADSGGDEDVGAASGGGEVGTGASVNLMPAPAGKSRLQSLLGAKRPDAGAASDDDDAADEALGNAASALSGQALHLAHAGFSPKFAVAMCERMAASGKRPVDLNTPWARQLLTQLAQLRGKERDPLVRVQPPAHLSEWVVEVTGAPGSLYDGERYKLQFNFDRSYPSSPPRVRFLRPVPKHEHVYSDGKICLNILYSDWKPEMTVLGVSQSLISMMASADEKKRPPDNAATIMSSIHQDPSKMQWIFHDDKC